MRKMPQNEQLSLSWDAHQKSICSGMSLLQQRGEFVDMTLAADGHHVKVHQMVLSLVSPYIKELISSAQCPHPVIFLNDISYTTLCSLLEYIYTGEVLVPRDRLGALITAGKALHIRGLREMDKLDEQRGEPNTVSNTSPPRNNSITEQLRIHRERKKSAQLKKEETISAPAPMCEIYLDDINKMEDDSTMDIKGGDVCEMDTSEALKNSNQDKSDAITSEKTEKALKSKTVQYSVSVQGGLQIIYNRYIYHLRYCRKKNRKRFWRCVDYSSNLKCPANICTDDNNHVVERSFTHNHPFHDSKIIKKVRLGTIFSMIQEAEDDAADKKKQRRIPITNTVDTDSNLS